MFAERARAYGADFAFCNLVGGQDELVFDGQSFVVDPTGAVRRPRRPVRGGAAGLRGARRRARRRSREPLADLAEVYAALVLGLRDYVAQERLPPRRRRRSRAGSTPPWWRCSPPTRSGRSTSAAWSCPRRIPAHETQAGRAEYRRQPGCRADRDPDRGGDGRVRERARRLLRRRRRPPAPRSRCRATRPGPRSPIWRPRTSRRGSAAT